MGEIEVNEYVRTDKGYIAKLKQYLNCTGTYLFDDFIQEIQGDKYRCISENELEKVIIKHSKQLIDLLEVKDVIKYRIENISTTLETKGYLEGITDISDEEMLQRIKNDKNYEILEILTHEQYEQNSYKVGGEDE